MKDRKFSEDIKIDENDLENVWLEHPSLVMYYNETYADAQHNRDLKKIALDQASAKLDSEIRKDWEKHFDSKPTEAAIRNYIILHPDYRKVELEHLESVKLVNLIQGVKNAFEHRKKALENIVSLRVMGYHSEPRNKVKDIQQREVHREQTSELKKKGKSRKRKQRK